MAGRKTSKKPRRTSSQKTRTSKSKRKSSGKRKLSKWNLFTKKVYQEMKKKKKDTLFKDALIEAKRRKNAGNY